MGELKRDLKEKSEIDAFVAGFQAHFTGDVIKEYVNKENGQRLAEALQARRAERDSEVKAAQNVMLEAAEKEEGAEKMLSGLIIKHIKVLSPETTVATRVSGRSSLSPYLQLQARCYWTF